MYEVPQTYALLEHLSVFVQDRTPPLETVNNLYKLPIIEPAVRYLHSATGLPTKRTWIKDIRKGNYLSWPLINVKNVNNFSQIQKKHKGYILGANTRACYPTNLIWCQTQQKQKKKSASETTSQNNTT